MKSVIRTVFLLSICLLLAPIAFGKVLVLTDDPYFESMIQQQSDLVQRSEDSLSGDGSLQVFSRNLYENQIQGWDFAIKQKPVEDNDYRYILIAWKQQGGRSLMIQLANQGAWVSALSYATGNPGNTLLKINLSPQSPSDWNVVVRDVYKDMITAQFEQNFNHNSSLRDLVITGIALTPWDGDYGLFDKIILGTDKDELMQIAEDLSGASSDPLADLKEQWDESLYIRYDWETVATGFSKIERRLTADQKRFFARDAALANAWLALDDFTKGKNSKALIYYKKAQTYLSLLGLPPDTWGLSYLKNLFQKKIIKSGKPSVAQKIALVVVPEIQTDTLEDAFDPGEYRKFILEWNLTKAFIEKKSGGRLSIQTELLLADGLYSGLTSDGKVDVSSIKPYPEELLSEVTQDFDAVVYYSPTLTVSSGGKGNLLLNSAPTYSPKRGIVILNRGHANPDDFMLPLHELAHVYEQFLGLSTTHSFRNDPNFQTKPLPTELAYYEKLFSSVIPGKIKNDWSALMWHVKYP
ncbi:hypothetical protein HZA43_05000 [Candidatus Peregrinibacteria bacterium]|nr:hypothetical protein [Candidatus Peregrinibacteria bacterium]